MWDGGRVQLPKLPNHKKDIYLNYIFGSVVPRKALSNQQVLYLMKNTALESK